MHTIRGIDSSRLSSLSASQQLCPVTTRDLQRARKSASRALIRKPKLHTVYSSSSRGLGSTAYTNQRECSVTTRDLRNARRFASRDLSRKRCDVKDQTKAGPACDSKACRTQSNTYHVRHFSLKHLPIVSASLLSLTDILMLC